MASTDTPFGMSFDELIAQVSAEGNAAPAEPIKTEGKAEATTSRLSFDEMVAQAQAGVAKEAVEAPSKAANEVERPLSFDELVAQAQAVATEEEPVTPKGAVVSNEAPASAKTDNNAAPLSFDALVAQAQTAAGISNASGAETTGKVWNPPSEEAPEEVNNEAETVEEAPDLDMNQPEAGAKEVPEAENQTEASEDKPEAKPTKSKRSKRKKAAPAEVPVVEDKTEDYRVELPQASSKADDSVTVETATMDTLFTPEEVASLRADIQTFVRRELKLALKGALKEVLNDFSK